MEVQSTVTSGNNGFPQLAGSNDAQSLHTSTFRSFFVSVAVDSIVPTTILASTDVVQIINNNSQEQVKESLVEVGNQAG
jgi:hypothetical protein